MCCGPGDRQETPGLCACQVHTGPELRLWFQMANRDLSPAGGPRLPTVVHSVVAVHYEHPRVPDGCTVRLGVGRLSQGLLQRGPISGAVCKGGSACRQHKPMAQETLALVREDVFIFTQSGWRQAES